jgi:hypothetical protein
VDFATVSGFITRPREGKDSFCAELHGGNLEVAAKVKRPIPQSDSLTKPASWKNEFLKYNKFPSFIFSSFIFAIYQSFREIFLLGQSDSFLDHAMQRIPLFLTIYSLPSYESTWLSFVKIHGFSKIKSTWLFTTHWAIRTIEA